MKLGVFLCVFALLALQQCLLAAALPTDTDSWISVHKCGVTPVVDVILKKPTAEIDPLKKTTLKKLHDGSVNDLKKLETDRDKKVASATAMEMTPEVATYLTANPALGVRTGNPTAIRTVPTAQTVPKVTGYANVDRQINDLNKAIADLKVDATYLKNIADYTAAVIDASLPKTVARLHASAEPWLIHGLWPKTNGVVAVPTAGYSTPTTPSIDVHWRNCLTPDNDYLWKHEWEGHGIYNNGRTSDEYFADTMNFFLTNKLAITAICNSAAAAAGAKVLQNIIFTPAGDCSLKIDWDAASSSYKMLATAMYIY